MQHRFNENAYFSPRLPIVASAAHLLPTYSALSFIAELSGGSTRPWAVLVLGANKRPQKFAVKLFRPYHLNQYPAIANEVFGGVLAEEFDLPSPAQAWIDFPPSFLSTLAPAQLAQLQTVPAGPKIGSAFLEGNYTYSPALAAKVLEPYDLETIYAFDNLILNVDRRPDKPNILFSGAEAYLIDHEMSFSVSDSTLAQLRDQRWEHNCRGHLFYSHLRTRGAEGIRAAFQTFGQYLRGMTPARLEPYQRQLETLGYGSPTFDTLLRYLCHQKAHSGQFEEILRRTLL